MLRKHATLFSVRRMATQKPKSDSASASGLLSFVGGGLVGGFMTALVYGAILDERERTWKLRKADLKYELSKAKVALEQQEREALPSNKSATDATSGQVITVTPARKKNPGTSHKELQTEQVAGYKNQIEKIRTELFQLHALGDYREDYGIQPARGMILYGPPGTGKTNLARAVSQTFSRNVRIINGPELKQEYVGVSERRLRELLEPACSEWRRRGAASDLYVYIFDEIDSLFPKRNGNIVSGAVKADNSMTTQILTLLDGVDSPRNIFIIGTTNRLEDLDEALLRPGRLEMQLEIGLPDEKDRLEILTLKTRRLRESQLLKSDVNLAYYAAQTRGFSGAELENLIKQGTQSAIKQNFTFDDKGNMTFKASIQDTKDLAPVTKADLDAALQELKHAREMRDSSNFSRRI